MALMPKRVLHRKQQRGRIRGQATRGNTVSFGDRFVRRKWLITARHMEAGRVALVTITCEEKAVYIRIPR